MTMEIKKPKPCPRCEVPCFRPRVTQRSWYDAKPFCPQCHRYLVDGCLVSVEIAIESNSGPQAVRYELETMAARQAPAL